MLTHVDRSPRLLRSRLDGTLVEPVSVWRVSERSRPDGVGTPTASRTRSSTPSFACSVRAPNRNGPHLWCGDALSHGSGRDRRYGTGVPNTSAALAVFPPE